MKKKEYKIIQTILFGIIAIVILIAGFNIYQLGNSKTVKGTRFDSYKNEFYVIGVEPTEYQIEKFEALTKALETSPRNDLEVADLVAQSFVIDFFGWSNKEGAYDVGGLQYMHNPEDFYKIAHFEYYQKLDVYNQSMGELPDIPEVSSSTKKIEDYKIEKKEYPTYQSEVKFSYGNTKLNTSELIDSIVVTTIKEDSGKLSIVNIKMIEEESKDNENDNNINHDSEEGDY